MLAFRICLRKARKHGFQYRQIKKTIGTYLKLVVYLVKPAILYVYGCWDDSMKKEIFPNKIVQFHMSMCKQILGVKEFTNNIKVLSELAITPLKIDIQTKMFKYFQIFPFIETNRYLFKTFKEDEFDTKGRAQKLKSLLDILKNIILKMKIIYYRF